MSEETVGANNEGSITDINTYLNSFNKEVLVDESNNDETEYLIGKDEYQGQSTYTVYQTEDGSTQIIMDEVDEETKDLPTKLESIDEFHENEFDILNGKESVKTIEFVQPELTVLQPVSASSLNTQEGTEAIQILSSQSECFQTNSGSIITTSKDKSFVANNDSFTNKTTESLNAQIISPSTENRGDVSYVLIVADNDGDKEHLQAVDLSQFDFKKARKKKIKCEDDDEKPLVCNYCDYTAPKKSLLQKHMKTHNDEKPHKCNICEYGFRSVAALQNHINTHTGIRPHKCKECNAAFTTAGEMVRHVRYRHTFEKPHKCPECDYSSVELSKLKRHIRSHTGERPYQCPHCSYASPDTFKLKRHLRIHTGEKPYECEICGARFTQSNSLKSHMPIHTGLKTLYQCELCPTTCGRKTDLKVHVQKMHTSDKPLVCKKCGKSFPDRYTFKIHSKIHDGEKCFKCELCPYAALSERHLQSHIYTHTGEKPYQCPECDQSFRQKQLLKRHINLYHNPSYVAPSPRPRKFECSECGRTFAHEGNLRRHMMIHNPEFGSYHVIKQMDEDDEDEVQYVQIVSDNGMQTREGVKLQLVSEDGQNTIYLAMEEDEPIDSASLQIQSSLLGSVNMKNSRRNMPPMMDQVVVHRSLISDEVEEIQAAPTSDVILQKSDINIVSMQSDPADVMVSRSDIDEYINGDSLNESNEVEYVFIKAENDMSNELDLIATKIEPEIEPEEPPTKRAHLDLEDDDDEPNEETYSFAVEIDDTPYSEML